VIVKNIETENSIADGIVFYSCKRLPQRKAQINLNLLKKPLNIQQSITAPLDDFELIVHAFQAVLALC
jgi:hypothetical protein